MFIAVTDEGAAQPPQEGKENPQKSKEEPAAKAVVREAVVTPLTSGEVDDPHGTVSANEDVEGDEENEEDEEEEEEDMDDDPEEEK